MTETAAPEPMGEDAWWAAFTPVAGDDGSSLLEYRDVVAADIHHVWTVVEGDDGETLYAEPGFHIVNVVGYALTVNPWTDIALSGVWSEAPEREEDETDDA